MKAKTKLTYRNKTVVDLSRIRKLRANELPSSNTRPALMHGEQIVSAKLFSFPPGGRDHVGPIVRRNAASLLPLLDTAMSLPDGLGHLRHGLPQLEKLYKGGHAPDSDGDYLSRQWGAICPVTNQVLKGTMCPRMGRGTSPAAVKKAIADRLRSARVAYGNGEAYRTQALFAKALGIEVERYKKWESGRTPIPPEFIGPICDLLGKDANYLYGIAAKEPLRKAG